MLTYYQRVPQRARIGLLGLTLVAALGAGANAPAPAAGGGAVPGPALPASQPLELPLVVVDVGANRLLPATPDAMRWQQLQTYYVGKSVADRTDLLAAPLPDLLRKAWERKARTFAVTPATAKAVDVIVQRFSDGPQTTTTVPALTRAYDVAVNNARSGLDYPALCQEFRVPGDRCVRLQYITGRITGQMLMAYSMTELFPGADGARNVRNYNTLLRHAGPEYVNYLPALGDKYLSAGPFQFTSYAVRHDSSGRQGASVVAAHGRVRIAGSVMGLTPQQQPVAAFYFATYNLMRLVKGLTPGQYAQLKRHSPLSQRDLTTYMAAAHHMPAGANGAARRWLEAGCAKPLRAYLRGRLTTYGAKSLANLEVL